MREIGLDCAICIGDWVEATQAKYSGNATTSTPRMSTVWEMKVATGLRSIM